MQHNFVVDGHKLTFCCKIERMKTEPLADGKEQFQPYMLIYKDTEMFEFLILLKWIQPFYPVKNRNITFLSTHWRRVFLKLSLQKTPKNLL